MTFTVYRMPDMPTPAWGALDVALIGSCPTPESQYLATGLLRDTLQDLPVNLLAPLALATTAEERTEASLAAVAAVRRAEVIYINMDRVAPSLVEETLLLAGAAMGSGKRVVLLLGRYFLSTHSMLGAVRSDTGVWVGLYEVDALSALRRMVLGCLHAGRHLGPNGEGA